MAEIASSHAEILRLQEQVRLKFCKCGASENLSQHIMRGCIGALTDYALLSVSHGHETVSRQRCRLYYTRKGFYSSLNLQAVANAHRKITGFSSSLLTLVYQLDVMHL
eukprot:SAG31_NODE_346_length_17349_cov_9.825875_2_plen_108_part_00